MTDRRQPSPTRLRIEWPSLLALFLILGGLLAVYEMMGKSGVQPEALAGLGALGALLLAALPAALRRVGVITTLVLVVMTLGASGCGASALRTHASIGTLAAVTVATTAPLLAPACDAALSECHGDADCVDRTATACLTATHAHDAARAGVAGYLDAIEVASLADEGLALPALLAGLRGLAALWNAARLALGELHVELPALPAVASQLLGGAS